MSSMYRIDVGVGGSKSVLGSVLKNDFFTPKGCMCKIDSSGGGGLNTVLNEITALSRK